VVWRGGGRHPCRLGPKFQTGGKGSKSGAKNCHSRDSPDLEKIEEISGKEKETLNQRQQEGHPSAGSKVRTPEEMQGRHKQTILKGGKWQKGFWEEG